MSSDHVNTNGQISMETGFQIILFYKLSITRSGLELGDDVVSIDRPNPAVTSCRSCSSR